MGFKRRRNLANRGINGWFSTLIDSISYRTMDTALECSYTDIYIILKIRYISFQTGDLP